MGLKTGEFNGDGKSDVAVLTASGVWYVGTFDGAAITYANWGVLRRGPMDRDVCRRRAAGRPVRQPSHFVPLTWSSLFLITPVDLARLHLDPNYFATIFEAYQYDIPPARRGVSQP